MIEDAAHPALQGGALHIGDTVLIWAAEERELSLRLTDVRLTGADGNAIARVPQLAFDLSVPALFRGMLAPTAIDLYGVRATILRRPGTGITLALARADEQPDPEAASLIGPMLEALVADDDRSSQLGYLKRLGIRQGKLRFIDEVNGVRFDAPSARLEISRGKEGLAGVLSAEVVIGDTTAQLEMNGILPTGEDRAHIQASATKLVPAALARMSPVFADYAIFDAPITAEGSLEINTDGSLHSAHLSLRAGQGEINLPEPWAATIPLEKAQGEINLDGVARRLEFEELSFKAGPHEASLKGTMDYRMGDGLNIASAVVNLVADRLHTEVPEFFEGPVDLDAARLKADIDFDALHADVEELFIGAGGGGLRLSGSIADAERSPAIKVAGVIQPMPFDELTAIWPLPLAKGARVWVDKNLSGGTVTGGAFDIDLAGGMIADMEDHKPIPKESLRFEFSASGATMKYLGEMPPMENVEARGLVEGVRFDAWVSSAVIRQQGLGDIAVSDGHFYDDRIHIKGAPGHISFTAGGATADILSLLDHEPLTLISEFGLDPRSIGGTGRLTGKISLPLVKDVTMDQVEVSGVAHVENVAIPDIQRGISVTSGTLDVNVTRTGLSAKGPISINNAAPLELEWRENFKREASPSSTYRLRGDLDDPGRAALGLRLDDFLAGSATIDATLMGDGRSVNRASIKADLTDSIVKLDQAGWWKKAGTVAVTAFDIAFLEDGGYRISGFSLTGDGIEASGSITLGDDGRMVAANFPVVKLGAHNDFAFVAQASEDAALAMDVTGARFDARGILGDLFSGRDAEEAGNVPGEPQPLLSGVEAGDPLRRSTLRAHLTQATGHNDTSFNDVRVDMVEVDGRMWSMDIDAVDQGGTPLTLKIGPDASGVRSLAVASNDAGNVFRALDFTRSVRGGILSASGSYDDGKPGSPLAGTVTIENFRIVDAPVLASILTLGSLTGIGDTLRGEGILFNRLEMPFTVTESRIRIDDARMSGPAIGLTMNGQIDRSADLVDMEGTLVPAYTINSFLGQVPLLGPLIVGREGEGIFAITYSVRGKADDPTVVVNPLSAIAPGFLRRIFEFGSTMPSESGTGRREGASPEAEPSPPADAAQAQEGPPELERSVPPAVQN
ncbi:MAG: AsmA-like C-terminal domain-containing protein [Parvibaculum sp.]|nr:AsmA-like C-terminal domain-containing protein [Parvibaculum sp.]